MDDIQKNLLKEISDIHELELGAYNVRINGEVSLKNTTANIDIVKKEDKSGIDIYIKPNTKNEGVHIPVILSQTGMTELVYNDFHIGENADVTIVAGCGIHNGGDEKSEHDGIHTFFIGKNAKVKYLEKHYGEGSGNGDRVLNPETIINIDEGGYMEMDTSQIKGVDSTKRVTKATLKENARLVIKEKIFTHGNQSAETDFEVNLDGENSSANVVSRSVAKDNSHQIFLSKVNGNSKCKGHTECDAIIMDKACVKAIPQISANNVEANLIHEAAIGKIAGEQLIKLMTLGLTESEAESQIINGFLK
ncbi:SufD family Fe-S cluster assembly protein [Clostridium sporogenes]|uniref:SufB/SufD family protein n=1 Tax=Clostridium sporogenes TaxID=1509 RepID=UPI0022375F6B|nr:SufD family Fe-S cluster assembly protein [Clostridium sporogenes]MCW6059643.1 SufD family Fe-S cluster assembly protein [Clostridium sporogenes]MCW6069147.1 SufD family Fe-S cluster assembly protein [Clostridium sporogenes]